MSEFTASNHYITNGHHTNGNSAKNGGNARAVHAAQMQSASNYNGKMAMAVEDEDDELDRGHWGSKAEFILSCIGFSVRNAIFVPFL